MTQTPPRLFDLSQDPLIELFELDTTPCHQLNGAQVESGQLLHWIAGTLGGQTVKFGGVEYQPLPIAAQDWQWNGQGSVPQPKLMISNYGGMVAGLTIAMDDLIGAKITRLRTFQRYLDGEEAANPNVMFQPDIFYINRKSAHDKVSVTFELATSFDQMSLTIPARKVLRNICGNTYRQWVNGTFVMGTCPYAGSACYLGDGTITTDPSKDTCSLRQSGCITRYGNKTKLPFDGFPGAGDTGNLS